jgi:hypothetical protein
MGPTIEPPEDAMLLKIGHKLDEAHVEIAQTLRDEFVVAKQIALYRARWSPDDSEVPSDVCRYCGRYWQRRFGSHLDGHAACIVPEDFKRRVGSLLRSPLVTYAAIAEVLGVTPAIVRSWAFSAGVAGPTTHKLRKAAKEATR